MIRGYFKPTTQVRARDIVRGLYEAAVKVGRKVGEFGAGMLQATPRGAASLMLSDKG